MGYEKLQKHENGSVEDEEEEEEEKWVKYYSSNHYILLVGEGDFSFSLSLAHSFGSAFNIVATSFDSHDEIQKKYKKALSNVDDLKKLGAFVKHGVDATKMKYDPLLKMWRFDRIIFNFPHAGFHGKEDNLSVINKHKNLVYGFFMNAKHMLRPNGEIHVNHKTTAPFSEWNIVGLASQSGLIRLGLVDFKKEDFPGYNQKRGDGTRCDEPFPLGECSTFMFALCLKTMKNKEMITHGNANHHHAFNVGCLTEQINVNPIHIQCSSYEYPFDEARHRNLIEAYGREDSGSVHGVSSVQPYCPPLKRNVGFGFEYPQRDEVRTMPSSIKIIESHSNWTDKYYNSSKVDQVLLSCGGRARNEASQPHHVLNGRSRFLEEKISAGRTGQSANYCFQSARHESEYINGMEVPWRI